MTGSAVARPVIRSTVTVQDDGDDCIIGDTESGTYISVPAVGGVVVRSLLDGCTAEEIDIRADQFAGEPVDVQAFIDVLAELGYLQSADARSDNTTPAQSAPVQQQRWVTGVSAQLAAPLFGRVAWGTYAIAAASVIVIFIARPDLLPRSADAVVLGDFGLSALVMVPLTWLMTGVHEIWHWLAARALGLRARFALDVRYGVMLVAETDLSQIWSIPRRRRFGPLLAGIAVQSVLLAAVLLAELLWRDAAFLRLLVLVNAVPLVWQCLIFFRTDLYGVLVAATGCTNLWRITALRGRALVGRASDAERRELTEASAADRRVSSWFLWIRVLGPLAAAGYLVWFVRPWFIEAVSWVVLGLGHGAATTAFWWTLLVSVVMFGSVVLTIVVSVIKIITAQRSARPTAA